MTVPFNRTPIGDNNPWQVKDYDCRTEENSREALALVARSGTAKAKEAVRGAVAKFWPDIGKPKSARDLFPNSNMK